MKILQVLFICTAVLSAIRCAKNEDEGRPYEFGFTIDGQQHRHEKKDANGIIQGEFGFITADGIYHVTTYATDENGSFRILSMRNVRVSDPLDGSGGNNFKKVPISAVQSAGNVQKPQNNAPLVSTPSPSKPSTGAEPISPIKLNTPIQTTTKRAPYVFTTQSTIKPACAGCGYVTRATTTPKPLVQANPSEIDKPYQNQIAQISSPQINLNQPPTTTVQANPSEIAKPYQNQIAQISSPQNNLNQPPTITSPPLSSGGPTTADLYNRNTNYQPDVSQQQPPSRQLQQSSISTVGPAQPSPATGPLQPLQPFRQSPSPIGPSQSGPSQSLPQTPSQNIEPPGIDTVSSIPSQPPQDSNQILQNDDPSLPNNRNNPDQYIDKTVVSGPNHPGSSRADKIRVENGNIYVPDNPPIKIKDKYPNMVDGLPEGIEEKDIVGLLYKFNYTIGFHGHYEKGLSNGTKIGGYFVNGRDGISRIVTYVADENGYRPKFRLINLGLDSPDTPKEDTEKTFGLKNFEFVWYPLV